MIEYDDRRCSTALPVRTWSTTNNSRLRCARRTTSAMGGGDVATASLLEVWIDEAELDALAWHILDKRPKTLLGLAIRARAEKHLCRYLWTVDFESLPA